MRLRKALARDLTTVVQLLEAADLPLDGVAEAFDGFVVAERDGRVVGAVGLERYGPDALLRSLVVSGGERGRGVGTELVDRLLADAVVTGVRAVYLLTTTAAPFFTARGFETIERALVPDRVRGSVEFVSACPSTAAVMRRTTVRAG